MDRSQLTVTTLLGRTIAQLCETLNQERRRAQESKLSSRRRADADWARPIPFLCLSLQVALTAGLRGGSVSLFTDRGRSCVQWSDAYHRGPVHAAKGPQQTPSAMLYLFTASALLVDSSVKELIPMLLNRAYPNTIIISAYIHLERDTHSLT